MIAAYLLKNGPDAGDNSGDSFVWIDPSGESLSTRLEISFHRVCFSEERKKGKKIRNVIASIVTLFLRSLFFSRTSRGNFY